MAEPIIASVVEVPEIPPSPQSNRKRGASEQVEDGTSPKRQRNTPPLQAQSVEAPTNADTAPAVANGDSAPTETARKTSTARDKTIDERKRSKRLFGGLLGTLAQKPTSNTAQKRRAEIEERNKEAALKREIELDGVRKERLERLATSRAKEQRRVDESDMRIRHGNILAMANFLKTEAEPILYYLPWEMRPEEHARIKSQQEDAEAEKIRDLERFEEQKRQWQTEDGTTVNEPVARDVTEEEADSRDQGYVDAKYMGKAIQESVGGTNDGAEQKITPEHEANHALSQLDGNENEPPNAEAAKQVQVSSERRPSVEEAGDVMDGGEDSVIY